MTADVGSLGGIVTGIVTDLEDPEDLGRVRVRFPWLDGIVSGWARLVSAGAGGDRGMFVKPEVDDEVLVAFELGDIRRPYVVGGLWNRQDPPPSDDGDAAANNWRLIRSRSGHVIRLDDTDGTERIEIVDKDERLRIVLDSSAPSIAVTADRGDVVVQAGDGSVSVEASGDVDVQSSSGTVTVKGARDVKVQATNVELKADANCSIEAGAVLKLKGSAVQIN